MLSIEKPIPAISNTDMVNNIPIIEKLISIKKEAFSSFNNLFPSSLSLIKSIVFERKKDIHIANEAINIEIKTGNSTIIKSHTLTIIEAKDNSFCIKEHNKKEIVITKGIIESLQNCFKEYALKAAFHDSS